MTQAYAELMNCVQMVAAQWRARRLLEGALATIAIAAGVLLVAAALDQVLDFGGFGRGVLGLAFWLSLPVALWRLVVRPVAARHGNDFYAALVEQHHPTLANRFINALQLGREDHPRCAGLIDAIVGDGLEAVEQVSTARAVARPALRRRLGAAVLALGLLVAYVSLFGPGARASVLRVLLPGADIPPYTRTSLEVLHERRVTILEGDPFTVRARAARDIPATAHLHWVDAQRRRGRVAMATEDADFSHTFAAVVEPFTFHVTAGDARSATVSVAVEPRPRIASMAVTYAYPAYTALPERVLDAFDGHLHGLPGTRARMSIGASKPLASLALDLDDGSAIAFEPDEARRMWRGDLTITGNGTFRVALTDALANAVLAPATYSINLEMDARPLVRIVHPGRDLQCRPGDTVAFRLVAADDLGLGKLALHGRVNDDEAPRLLHAWPTEGAPRQMEPSLEVAVADLGLGPGDRLEYWAAVEDLNPGTGAAPGPGRAQSRKYQLYVLSDEQTLLLADRQVSDYAQMVGQLIKLQRTNRAETAALTQPPVLATRQGLIRRNTLRLADIMTANRFPGASIIAELGDLAVGPMADVLRALESCRDAEALATKKGLASGSLADQDAIITALEAILLRLNRNEQMKRLLRKTRRQDPVAHRQITATLEKLARDLDRFLFEVRELEEDYEKIAKRKTDELSDAELEALEAIEHRLDRWKKWHGDSVDEIAKLPEGFVTQSHLKDDLNTIFEEIEKKARPPTIEIATPVEEGAKMIGTTVMEDLEIWMMDIGDNLRWVMEEPPEGKFEVPPYTLPDSLQDMIGDLIEDVDEFDEEADDMTSAWGGNMPVAGWDVMDGPISVFSAQGKTGNQLPNTSELTGRSGGGRRGKSSGQMVGSESRAYEGRPTPARLTKERYEEGLVDASKQLDPRGATGGGRKTGGGQRGLQGGTPPDMVRDMERLAKDQMMLREKTMQLARAFNVSGRSSWRLDRAARLLASGVQDLQDRRYQDAARKRKVALSDLRATEGGLDEAVSLSLDKARRLPPEMRDAITAGTQQPLPEGFEEIVGAYYRALSEAGGETDTNTPRQP